MTTYFYSYKDKDGAPLEDCPHCGADLTDEFSVSITLSCGGHVFDVLTHLDEDGGLVDTEDRAVERGHHSQTDCAQCGEGLIEYECCEEVEP